MCLLCTRFRELDVYTPKCDSFPDGIPQEIYFEAGDHRLAFEGEKLLFEPVSSLAEREVRDLWGRRPTKIVPDLDDGGPI
jgi:hypothetical protein